MTKANRREDMLRTHADSDSGRAKVNVTSTRAVAPDKDDVENPVARGYPAPELANAPHCLLSPVLDSPMLLSRERRHCIGRDPSVDVRIKSDLVSRRHAQLHYDGQGFVLSDLGSLNGTCLNGFRIQTPCPLHDGDRISFGGFEFVVRVLHDGEDVDEQGGTTKIFKDGKDLTASNTPIFTGDLKQLALKDVIELIDWKQHSGTLNLQPEGMPGGYLYFVRGRLINATSKSSEGLEPCLRLLAARAGRFSFQHGEPRCPETLTHSFPELWALAKQQSG